ncbi:hypothetical protein ACQRIU_006527 [Beauveria bassiana]
MPQKDQQDLRMKSDAIVQRLNAALPIIRKVCEISGVSAASIGVIHQGQSIYVENIGHRNVEAQLSPTADTLYGLGSLAKGFVAASLAQLLHNHPNVTWTTPLQDNWPEYRPQQPQLKGNICLLDFLSHRTGLSGDMSVALQGDMEFILSPSEVAPIVSRLDVAAPFRQSWLYNNWGYSVAGIIIEKLSGKPAHEYIRESILMPLGLSNTALRPVLDEHIDFADAYAALEDASTQCLPRKFPFLGSLFETAGGMYSTVNDMLKYCQALLQSRIDPQSTPLGNLEMLFQGHIPLDQSMESYGSYGMGWIETHLPGVLGLQGDNAELFQWDELPYIGDPRDPSKSILTLYHQGASLGYYSAIYLFPEIESGFVVLTNSMPLSDAADWIAQIVAAALHGFETRADYVELANEARRRKVGNVAAMMAEIEKTREQHPGNLPRPLDAYCGDYYNGLGNFYVRIKQHKVEDTGIEPQTPQNQVLESTKNPAGDVNDEESHGDDAETQPEHKFLVSSHILRHASQVFRKDLDPSGPWRQPEIQPDGLRHKNLDGFDPKALKHVLDLIHFRNDQVPDKLEMEELAEVAVIVDYFQCHEAMRFVVKSWIREDRIKEVIDEAQPGRPLILWLLIASVFGIDAITNAAAKTIIENNKEPFDSMELPFSESITCEFILLCVILKMQFLEC